MIKVGDMVSDKNKLKYIILDEEIFNEDKFFICFSENGCVKKIKQSLLTKIKDTTFVESMLQVMQS